MRKICFFMLFFMFFILETYGQTDTSFWFAAPEITSSHGDRPIYLRITALAEDAVVTISQPANISFTPIIVNVAANTSQNVDLTSFIDALENNMENVILQKGLYIRSTKFITVYYEESSNNNPEIFGLKGRNALGLNFFIPAQNLMQNDWIRYSILPKNSFDIVATENNTTITITPAKDITGHAAGNSFTIVLNKGETYSAVATSNLADKHLNGSTVIADKPIAITIKDDSLTGGGYANCADLAGEQIVPITMIGTKYISLPGYLNNPSTQPTDNIFILATEDNTTVSFNGIQNALLSKGQTFVKQSYSDVFYIETNKPVYVLHLSGFGCEVGTALLPQLECSGSKTVAFTRSSSTGLYLNILVPTGGESNFSFNGNTSLINATLFNDVPNTNSAWKYARIQINTSDLNAGNAAIIKNSTHDFHLGIIHGDAATGCRYGYFSGFNKFDAVSFSNATPTHPVCNNDTLKLFCDVGASENISFYWIGPNGFTSTEKNPVIPHAQFVNSGTYTVTATKLNCNTIVSSVTVTILPKPIAKIITIPAVCEGTTIHLDASNSVGGTDYLWTGVNSFTSTKKIDSIINTTVTQSGKYILAVSKDGCTAYDTADVMINAFPILQLSSNAPLCKLKTLQISCNNSVVNTSYHWVGPNAFTSASKDIVINNFNYADTGIYILQAISNNCSATKSIYISLKEIPVLQFDVLPFFCENSLPIYLDAIETTGIAGTGSYFVDNLPIVNNIFYPANYSKGLHQIAYKFAATNGCEKEKIVSTQINAPPKIKIKADTVIMLGNAVKLNTLVSEDVQTVLWQPNQNLYYDTLVSPIVKPVTNTLYKVKITATNSCKNSDSIFIKVIERIFVPNVFSPNADGKNDLWVINDLKGFYRCTIEVYDRNGNMVFNNTGNTKFWDGMYNNKPVPTGVYYYIIKLNDGYTTVPLTGSLLILK